MKKQKSKKGLPAHWRGFSMIEVVIAVSIITTALIASLALITSSISSIQLNKTKIIATGLAQEGLEIVRNIRDNNWLDYKRSSINWLDGLSAGDYRVQYDSESLLAFSPTPLKIDSNGFYKYGDSGTNTPFYRKITIQIVDENQIKVTAVVSWTEKRRSEIVSAETRLYNWLRED